jgi:hypothetical protein
MNTLLRATGRRLGFVLVNTALTAGFAFALTKIVPPLEDAPPSFLLIPLTMLAAPTSLALHVVVGRMRSSLHRGFALWGAFVVMMLGYGSWMALHQPTRGPLETAGAVLMIWPASLLMGHWFGAPAFFVFGAINKLLSPWLTPRAATAL